MRDQLRLLLLEVLGLFNCVSVGYALFTPLIRAGEPPSVAALTGLFAAIWFGCIQLFLVITHVQGQSRVSGLFSRLCCVAFLSFFGFLVSLSLTFGMDGNGPGWWLYGSNSLFFASFLAPWFTAPRLLGHGAYHRAQLDAEATCLSRWEQSFVPRYEELVRKITVQEISGVKFPYK